MQDERRRAARLIAAAVRPCAELRRVTRARALLLPVGALLLAVTVVLNAERRPLTRQPYPDALSYVTLARSLASGGGWDEGTYSGRYPPGFPLLLAPFSGLHLPSVAVGLTVALVVAVWLLARRVGGDAAAAAAVLLLVASGSLRHHASWVMSDVPAALLTVLAVLAVVHGRDRLGGILVGLGVAVRLAQLPLALGLRRRGWLPCAGVLVALAASRLVWPWGYSSGQVGWAPEHLWSTGSLAGPGEAALPNVVAYPAMLLGLHGQLVLPGAVVLAALALWVRPERRFVLVAVAGSLAVHLPYAFQAQRFLFPVLALVAVYGGVGAAEGLAWLRAVVSGRTGGEGTEPAEVDPLEPVPATAAG
jgi:hypothetical protein